MKQSIKKIIIFLTLCFTLLFLSCNLEEDAIKENNYKAKFTIKEERFDKLLQLPSFNDAYQRVVDKKGRISSSTQAKTALEEQYGFTIVEQVPVKVITDAENGTFYVMLIERPTSENLKFENLIVNIKDDKVGAVIMKYEMSGLAVKEPVHNLYSMNIIDTQMTPLEVDGKKMYTATEDPCVTTAILMCDDTGGGLWEHNHVATQYCIDHSNNLYVVWGTVCSGGGGGSTGTSNTTPTYESTPSGNTSPNNSSTTGGTPTLPSSPIPCTNCIQPNGTLPSKTPCEALKDLSKPTNGNISGTYMELVSDSQAYQGEQGALFKRNNNTYTSYMVEPSVGGGADSNTVILSTASTVPGVYGAIHSHPDSDLQTSMYSFNDLHFLWKLYKDADPMDQADVVFMLYLPPEPGTTYALKIYDFTLFQNFLVDFINELKLDSSLTPTKKTELINDKFHSKTKQGDLKNFLEIISGKGVDLYRNNGSHTNPSWSKLSLNNTSVINTPCPN